MNEKVVVAGVARGSLLGPVPLGVTSSALHCAPSGTTAPLPSAQVVERPVQPAAPESVEAAVAPVLAPGVDDARGGRLFDNWRAEASLADILAASCNRTTFPPLPGKASADVPNGDPRCGAYLK